MSTPALRRSLGATLLALAACKSPRAMEADGGPESPDAALDGAPDAPADAAPDAPADAALVDMMPDAPGPMVDPFAALAKMPGTCSLDQWCWMAPTPAGNTYDHEFATGPDNIWLIGGKGIALQWDGTTWHDRTPPPLPGTRRFELAFSISGLGPNDMWLAEGSTLQHWDGTQWTIEDSGVQFGNVWEAPNGEVWCTILNTSSVAHRAPGGTFQHIGVGSYAGNIWGLSAEDFWVMSYTNIVHYANGQFTTLYSGPDVIGMVGGAALEDMWFGGSGVLIHYAGGTFTKVPTGLSSNAFINFAGATSTSDVNFFTNGEILHWDGTALTTTQLTGQTVGGEGRIIDGHWWIAGYDGGVSTVDANNAQVPVVDAGAFYMRPQWGSSKDDMYWTGYAGGANGIQHWDGTAWSTIAIDATTVSGVHAAGGNELFAGGVRRPTSTTQLPTLFHYDGTAWAKDEPEAEQPAADARAVLVVTALGPGEALAIGTKGLAYRYRAGAWAAVATSTTDDFRGIWAADADHAILTTASGVYLWDRANPDAIVPDPTFVAQAGDQLGPIHGADGIAWLGITNSADAWRRDAAGYARVTVNNVPSAIWAESATNVLVVCDHQAVFTRFDGTSWVAEDNNSWTGIGSVVYRPPGGPTYVAQGAKVVIHP